MVPLSVLDLATVATGSTPAARDVARADATTAYTPAGHTTSGYSATAYPDATADLRAGRFEGAAVLVP